MFLGYYKPRTSPTFDAEGWFDTGDLAYADNQGYIPHQRPHEGRLLIRGGERAGGRDRGAAHGLPAVAEAALVGYPDARLGERGCAFVVLRPVPRCR